MHGNFDWISELLGIMVSTMKPLDLLTVVQGSTVNRRLLPRSEVLAMGCVTHPRWVENDT